MLNEYTWSKLFTEEFTKKMKDTLGKNSVKHFGS